jgi:hypothetical protein
MVGARDAMLYKIEWDIFRYSEDDTARLTARLGRAPQHADFLVAGVPTDHSRVHGNLVTTAGLNRWTSRLIANTDQALAATSGRVGVGDGAGTAAVGDTDLSASAGSTHRWFQVLDATYPTQANGLVTCKATLGASDGNFAWNEICIDIGTPTVSSGNTVSALLLNHKTSIAQGTKTSGQSWTASATITYS